MGFLKKKFRSIKKLPGWLFWLPAHALELLFHLVYRVRYDDPRNLAVTGRGYVSLMWHNRLFSFAAVFPRETRKHTVAVVSASRDGQYIVDLIAHFGLKSLRGSSSKRGANAQRQAIRAIREGCNVAFTPDGPRGPKYRLKPGPLHLAQLTGAPVLPMSVNASSYWQVKSWDNFQIPKPGATVTLKFGEPIVIPPELTDEEFECWRRKIEDALLAVTVDRA